MSGLALLHRELIEMFPLGFSFASPFHALFGGWAAVTVSHRSGRPPSWNLFLYLRPPQSAGGRAAAARRRLHLYLRPPQSAGWRPAAARGGAWRGRLSRRGIQHTQAFRHGTLGPNPFAPPSPFVPGPPGPVSAPVIATTVVVALVTGAGTLAPLPPPAKRRSRAIFTGSFREETRNVAPHTARSRRRPKGRQGHRPMESSTYSAGRMPSLR